MGSARVGDRTELTILLSKAESITPIAQKLCNYSYQINVMKKQILQIGQQLEETDHI